MTNLEKNKKFKKLVYKELMRRPIIGYTLLLEFSDDELKRFAAKVLAEKEAEEFEC